MAAILSLNGAKNNSEIVTKITAVRPKGGGGLAQGPPLNTPLLSASAELLVLMLLSFMRSFEDAYFMPQQVHDSDTQREVCRSVKMSNVIAPKPSISSRLALLRFVSHPGVFAKPTGLHCTHAVCPYMLHLLSANYVPNILVLGRILSRER